MTATGPSDDGLAVRDLTSLDEFEEAGALVCRVWGSPPERSPLNVQQLPAMVHAGCQVTGAFLGGELVGTTVAFVGLEGRTPILHSHVTGVEPGHQGRGIGLALKRYQRRWCLERGIGVVTWTFDPLVRANGRFNLFHLGARGVEYLRNLYGLMGDDLNRDDPTDRLVARWTLDAPWVAAALASAGPAPASVDLLGAGAEPAVVVGACGPRLVDTNAPRRLVATPEDVVALRAADRGLASAWRQAVRGGLEGALADGHVVVSVTADGDLVTEAPGRDRAGAGP